MKEWRAVFVAVLFMFFAIAFIAWMGSAPTIHFTTPAAGAEAVVCDYPESLIVDALKDSPERLIKKLEGKDLEAFLSKMQSAGYLSGSLPSVTIIYVISGKLLPSHTTPIDILFFVDANGCIVGKVYGTASVVEAML